jgi:hypothetical protein
MNLFKKVLIVGLATMALGSAAMGDSGNGVGPSIPDCKTISEVVVPPAPGVGGGNTVTPGLNSDNPNTPVKKPIGT